MKRSRDEKSLCDDNGKKNTGGKILYHCTFHGCKFIACTEHNIEHHMHMKHMSKSTQPKLVVMSDSSFIK
jgi:hypothetical protein